MWNTAKDCEINADLLSTLQDIPMEITLKIDDHIKLIQMIADLRADCTEKENYIKYLESAGVAQRAALQRLEDSVEEQTRNYRTTKIDLEYQEGHSRRLQQDLDRAATEIKELRDKFIHSQEVMPNGFTPHEQALLDGDKKIQAIKAVRERTDMGLAEAKKYVEERYVKP
jgi:ribosomal protein L7/L12